ncbi:MAG: hypothetical protein LBO62_05625 [Endomicrobium sp.]|nr:hypothetical protein [Endomicrobium sp.]
MKKIFFAAVILFFTSCVFAQDKTEITVTADRQAKKKLKDQIASSEEEAAKQLKEMIKIEKLNAAKEKEERLQKIKSEALGRISLAFDYDLNFRAASYSNINYSSSSKIGSFIFAQHLSVNIVGKFDDNIEMSAKISSYGLSGKENAAFTMQYEDAGSAAFVETAFLTFRDYINYDIAYSVSAGKQPFSFGNGFIIGDNNNGLLGASAKIDFYREISFDLFAAKDNARNFDVYGGVVKIDLSPLLEIGVFQERNNTGFGYVKGVLDERSPIDRDDKTFYDLRISGGNEKYKYSIEAAKQLGKIVKSSSEISDYDVYAFAVEGSWKGKILNLFDADAKAVFSFSNSEGKNIFNPSFAKRYDGVKKIGYGTFAAANVSDVFFTLPSGYAGVNTFGFQLNSYPLNFLQVGAAWYFYSSSDAPAGAKANAFGEIYGAKGDLGSEADLSLKYSYKNYFDVTFDFALYLPPSDSADVFTNTQSSYLFQIGVISKF